MLPGMAEIDARNPVRHNWRIQAGPNSREKLFFFPTIVLDLSPFERLSFDALISLCLMEEKYWVLSWPHLKLQLTLTL